MEFPYWIDSAHHVVRIGYAAPLTVARLAATLRAVRKDAAFAADLGWVIDHRSAPDAPSVSYVEGVVHSLEGLRPLLAQVRWATVVDPAAAAAYGMARMTELLLDNRGLAGRTCTSLDEAITWPGSADATGTYC